MGKIRWTHTAVEWLRNIYEYISVNDPETARKVSGGIFNKAKILEKFPYIGYELIQYRPKEIRVLLYGHYRIVYLIKNDNNIDILGVFHGSIDIKRYLKKNLL